jgi:hypothetical protein
LVVVLVLERQMIMFDSIGKLHDHHAKMSKVAKLYAAEAAYLRSKGLHLSLLNVKNSWQNYYMAGEMQEAGDLFSHLCFFCTDTSSFSFE